jgi:hypothetical protein
LEHQHYSDASAEGDGWARETASLLPAAGISTNEREGKDHHHKQQQQQQYRRKKHGWRRQQRSGKTGSNNSTMAAGAEENPQLTARMDNRTANAVVEQANKVRSGHDDDDDWVHVYYYLSNEWQRTLSNLPFYFQLTVVIISQTSKEETQISSKEQSLQGRW